VSHRPAKELHLITTSTARRSLSLALATALLPAGARAQAVDPVRRDTLRADSVRVDSVLRLPALRIRGPQPLATVGGTSAVEVDLRDVPLGAAPTLEDVLREVPMLHVRTNSRGETELLARGSESRQVAVLLDGVPLTLGWDARADVSVIGASAVELIRFTRGLSSLLHGPNVLGGVIEATVAGEHRPQRAAQLAIGYEHTGGTGASASFTLPFPLAGGEVLLRAGASGRDTPGTPLARGITEPLPAPAGLRLNTDVRSMDAFAALRYRSGAGAWMSTSTSMTHSSRGIAAELDVASPRFWRYPHVSRAVAVVSGGTGSRRTPLGVGEFEASLGYDAGRTEIVAYSDRRYVERRGFELGSDRTLTARLLGEHALGERGKVRTALTFAGIRHYEELAAASNTYEQQLGSLGVETLWLLARELGPFAGVRLSVGGAYDAARVSVSGDKPEVPDSDAWGGRAGLSALAPGDVQLHAGISRRGRFPALREAFSGALDRFAPNPGLRPEVLTAAELGATRQWRNAQLQAVAFQHRLDDAIVRITTPDLRFMRVNENRLRSRGLELLGSAVVGPVTVGGDVALQSAVLVSPLRPRGRPENQPAFFGSSFVQGALHPSLTGRIRLNHTGRQFCLAPTGEEVALAGGTRIDADVSRHWRLRRSAGMLSRAEVRLAVDNVAGTAVYDQCGLPQGGRLAHVRLRLF
jgi:iron complex outermembrane recepter protein